MFALLLSSLAGDVAGPAEAAELEAAAGGNEERSCSGTVAGKLLTRGRAGFKCGAALGRMF